MVAVATATSAETVKTLVYGATIVTMAPDRMDPVEGWMSIGADGKIIDIGGGEPPESLTAEATVDATGKIVMPGFLSADSNLWSAPFRGIAAESDLYEWIEIAHAPFESVYTPNDFYTYTLYGALDYMGHGITTCFNWVANLGYPYEMWLEQFETQLACEQRFIFGWAIDITASEEVNRERLEAFHKRTEKLKATHPNMLDIGLSSLGLLAGDTETPFIEGRIMRDYDLNVSTHFLEAAETKYRQQRQFKILEDAGMVNDQLMIVHFIHASDHIVDKAAESGVRMVWNPISNGRLGSGLADIPDYINHGIEVGMGLDGQASGDHSDPFENMRMGLYAQRMKHESASVMTPFQILALHTIGSAKMLRVADRVGSLEPGKFGDFLILDPKSPDVAPIFDIYATIVFALSTRNLDAVYIGGDKSWEAEVYTEHDFPAIRDDVYKRVKRMTEQLRAEGKPVPTPTYQQHFHQP